MAYDQFQALVIKSENQEFTKETIDRIKQFSGDYVCMTGIYKKKVRKKIVKLMQNRFPFAYLGGIGPRQFQSRKFNCRLLNRNWSQTFFHCLMKQGLNFKSQNLSLKVIRNCRKQLKAENLSCQAYVLAQVDRPLFEVAGELLFGPAPNSRFQYQGHSGLLTMSKYPVKNIFYHDFSKTSLIKRKELIKAILVKNKTPIKVGCSNFRLHNYYGLDLVLGQLESNEIVSNDLQTYIGINSKTSWKLTKTDDFLKGWGIQISRY